MLTAGQERQIDYDFIPDQVLVVPRLDSIILTTVDIVAIGAQGGGRHQLRGTGPIVLPGITKQVYFRNNESLTRTLIVTAQKGYAPFSVVMPTTSAFGDVLVLAERTALLTIANNVNSSVAWQSAISDPYIMWSASVNPQRFICRVKGIYTVTVELTWAVSGLGLRRGLMVKNGAIVIAGDTDAAPSATEPTRQSFSAVADFAVGDYVQTNVLQTSGGPLDLLWGASNPLYSSMVIEIAT